MAELTKQFEALGKGESSSGWADETNWSRKTYGHEIEEHFVGMEEEIKLLETLMKIEEGVTLPDDSSTSSSAEKGKLENKKAKDSEALYYIQTAVADHIFPRISVATSAKEAWSIFTKGISRQCKVRELVNQLKAYGEDIPEKRVVEKLLISVTEKYDPIVTTIEETKDITTLTVTELVGSLEAYEKRRSRREENSLENAFQSKLNMRSQNSNRKKENFKSTMEDKKKQNMRPCRICKRTNHLEKDCYFRGKPQCRNCKRFGHMEKDCRLKGNHQANCIEENNSSDQLFYTCNSVAEIGEATWYIDSAASNHMTYNKELFRHWTSHSRPTSTWG
ncbi:hypothetical protein Sango_0614900 [Sesamum angolense]|uniref:CCHC-type domain-containing protein n=1 Tax=Sesamum angolense TaxID=2727404 RepID=A0AAE2C1Y9_9LAMI|nr:hypothetical protein Sango_0614900 [Sesamum angolense]